MWGFFIAIISGALMSIQGVFNTEITKQSSIWVAAGFVQLTAFLTCVALWFFSGREALRPLFQTDNKYMLTGGVIGAFITYTVIRSIDKLGPAKAIMAIVISQVLVAYGIELFGMFGMEKVEFQWRKLLGVVVMLAGLLTFKWESGR